MLQPPSHPCAPLRAGRHGADGTRGYLDIRNDSWARTPKKKGWGAGPPAQVGDGTTKTAPWDHKNSPLGPPILGGQAGSCQRWSQLHPLPPSPLPLPPRQHVGGRRDQSVAGEAVSAQPARPHSPKTCHRRAAQSPDAAGSRFPRPGAWQPFDGLTRSSKLPGEPGITPSPYGQLKPITSPDRAAWVGSAPLNGCEFGEAEARTEVCAPRFEGTAALLAPANVPPCPEVQKQRAQKGKSCSEQGANLQIPARGGRDGAEEVYGLAAGNAALAAARWKGRAALGPQGMGISGSCC